MKKLLFALLTLSWPIVQGMYAQELTTADEKTLLYMIEEEKMARDVYAAFEAKWGATIFNHISEAEGKHFERVLGLAQSQGVKVPNAIEKNKAGQFRNKELQAMYDEFIASGSQSLEAALRVGALLEETNYRDLSAAIAATDNEAVRTTFTQLLDASANHLRAFSRNLSKQGVDYQPAVLPQADFDAIMADTDNVKNRTQGAGRGKGKGQGKGCCQQAAAQNGQGAGPKAGCCQGKGQGQGCKAKSR